MHHPGSSRPRASAGLCWCPFGGCSSAAYSKRLYCDAYTAPHTHITPWIRLGCVHGQQCRGLAPLPADSWNYSCMHCSCTLRPRQHAPPHWPSARRINESSVKQQEGSGRMAIIFTASTVLPCICGHFMKSGRGGRRGKGLTSSTSIQILKPRACSPLALPAQTRHLHKYNRMAHLHLHYR